MTCVIINISCYDIITARTQQRPYTKEELTFLKENFKENKKPPTNEEVRQAQDLYSPLKKRTVAQIKTRAWALLQVSRYET